MKPFCAIVLLIFAVIVSNNARAPAWLEVSDHQEFKYIIKSRNNVLVCFYSSETEAAPILKVVKEVAEIVRGEGTIVLMDCNGASKKLCKRLKAIPEGYLLRHYYRGKENKEYDRGLTVTSMVHFLRDPDGEAPWEEDSTAAHVRHLSSPQMLSRLVKSEKRPVLVMFYAPWCSYCRLVKPEYAAAAAHLQPAHVLAAVDVHRPENNPLRTAYNITSLPTIAFFRKGVLEYYYEGKLKKDDLVGFMKAPSPETAGAGSRSSWSESPGSQVLHLTSQTFDTALKEVKSLLVAFYAPWCGHCKKLHPEFEEAAKLMQEHEVEGRLGAVDATLEPELAKRFEVRGYPTLVYFSDGQLRWELPHLREAGPILRYMTDPTDPRHAPAPPPDPDLWEDTASSVVFLTPDTFKPFLKKKKHALVVFYAPWCTYCKKVKPEFVAAAEELADESEMSLCAVDCTKYSGLCQEHGVEGFPTLKYLHHLDRKPGQVYTGPRKKDDLVRFMRNVTEMKTNKKDEL